MDRVNNNINTSHLFSRKGGNMPFIYHSGSINPLSVSAIITRVEDCLSLLNSPKAIKNNVVGITIEMLQNVQHHSPPGILEDMQAFIFEEQEGGFIITTSNAIQQSKIPPLEKKITSLNCCINEELKNKYLSILKNGPFTGEHAGIGLIDIRRKSGNPVLFKFTPKGNNYSLFTVSVLV